MVPTPSLATSALALLSLGALGTVHAAVISIPRNSSALALASSTPIRLAPGIGLAHTPLSRDTSESGSHHKHSGVQEGKGSKPRRKGKNHELKRMRKDFHQANLSSSDTPAANGIAPHERTHVIDKSNVPDLETLEADGAAKEREKRGFGLLKDGLKFGEKLGENVLGGGNNGSLFRRG
ncbi:hypothetical protein F5876DRAFT_65612 [Lentinula aff. lateritia]|uniref:Uncharacterized protein n=1 Tax=Lentinula aff. lateritia TaxID=2804960 RepID=A0ACC1U1I9_9AGAR|nr:hypothetical protein F5876DRAFT_65612 [Lentinula aff. lateritia]